MILAALLSVFPIYAQTARQLSLPLSEDGQARLEVWLPENPTGRAVVCCPGGGYAVLSNTHEGAQWSEFFNARGIAFALVNYRIPHGDRTLPISDATQAMKTMRDSAAVWQLNPRDIGIMGFSAGGHLASTIATHTPYELRPNFQILVYPVITMNPAGTHQGSLDGLLGDQQGDQALIDLYSNEKQVKPHLTPPALIVLANDDTLVPPVPNAIAYYSAMRSEGNSCTLHIYPSGGHGFGYMPFFRFREQMLADMDAWLAQLPVHSGDEIRVACIGDSITDGYGIDLRDTNGYPAQMQRMLGDKYWVKNFGVSAATTLDNGDFPYKKQLAWEDAQAFNPNIVVVKLGTNDSKPYNWAHKADFAPALEELLSTLEALPAKPRILLATPVPAGENVWSIQEDIIEKEIIPIIRQTAARHGLTVIDLHEAFEGSRDLILPDGIHPNQQGARKMAEIIAKQIDPEAKTEQRGFFGRPRQ